MPTIKTKKEMNLGELLCWAIDNKEQARFRDISSKSMRVRFNDNAKPEIIFAKRFLPTYETFTVEIEEPVTEDTEFETLIEVTEHQILNIRVNRSVKEIKDFNSLEFHALVNGRLTLIWTKEEGLVE